MTPFRNFTLILWVVTLLCLGIANSTSQEKFSIVSASDTIRRLIPYMEAAIKTVQANPLASPARELERVAKEISFLSRVYPELPLKAELIETSNKLTNVASEIAITQEKLREQIREIYEIHHLLAEKVQFSFIIAALKEEVKTQRYEEAHNDLMIIQKFLARKKAEKKEEEVEEIAEKRDEGVLLAEIEGWLNRLKSSSAEQKQGKKVKFPAEKFDAFLQNLENSILKY